MFNIFGFTRFYQNRSISSLLEVMVKITDMGHVKWTSESVSEYYTI